MIDDETICSPWFLLAESVEKCWSCSSDTKVFAILLPNVEDGAKVEVEDEDDTSAPTPCSLSNISDVNNAVETYLKGLSPHFFPDDSRTAGQTYWMNHCENCSIKIGDFYLHSKPGHAFFPVTDEEIGRIKLRRIDIALEADAGWGQSSWIDELLENVRFSR
ncbi:hypothetical protein [Collimonas sp.]|jgi:hypothetical protein|uniref:hypothetical protein n=1 Tax=Collimonas sp. TaxID=1963772 RepID=UPI002CBF02E9|nr:hypothetical protein [Collimonas sp.]HWW04164.1 hypothetical protein [Collimonas sp.]